MRPFRSRPGPVHVAGLEPVERDVLLDVVTGVLTLLGAEPPGPATAVGPAAVDDLFASLAVDEASSPPQDPALRRLLPDASADPELAAELRRLTEPDVRRAKVAHLRLLWSAVQSADPELVVPHPDAPAVAAALTDLRLVLASRLDVLTDEDAEQVYADAEQADPQRTDDEGRGFLAVVYVVLTELQESLVQCLIAALPPAAEDPTD